MSRSGALACVLALATVGCSQPAVARRASSSQTMVAPLGAAAAPATSRDSLERTRRDMEARLKAEPADAQAAVRLADALLRLSRVTNNAGLALQAERALGAALKGDPDRYDARRMLATVYLSQHRFEDAIREAERCAQIQPRDAWPHGVIGDAAVELGDYDRGFQAFDQMLAMRPDAAGYARASYARELQGDLAGALRLMTMALEATSPNDQESLAWHHAQLASIHLSEGRLTDAAREYAHAEYVFPDHPFAVEGLARVDDAKGRPDKALARLEALSVSAPSASTLAYMAELSRKIGKNEDSARYARLSEAVWRSDSPDPVKLALLLAGSGVPERIQEAVRIAEAEAGRRNDIFTNDALAWAYFNAGRTDEAAAAIARATRTGSQDRLIRAHARAVARARTQ